MISLKRIFISLILFTLLSCSLKKISKNESNPWQELTKRDLAFIYKTILNDHPGPVDELNPDFKIWLEEGYKEALKRTEEVTSFAGYVYLLRYYVNGFQDGHVYINFKLERENLNWSGFLVAYQNGKFLVEYVDSSGSFAKLPEINDELVSCNDMKPMDLMNKNIFPFQGIHELEAELFRFAPLLFVFDGNPWAESLDTCVFRSAKNKEYFLSLEKRPIGNTQISALIDQIRGVPDRTFTSTKFGNNSVWIKLPSFDPKGNSELLQMRSLMQTIEQEKEMYRKSDMVVFDVRGNSGGSSVWGQKILMNLYGEKYVRYKSTQNFISNYNVHALWRVSPSNYNYHLTETLPELERNFGPDSEAYKEYTDLAEQMKQALTKNIQLIREGQDENTLKRKANEAKQSIIVGDNLNQAQVFLLTDSRCGSACLDFCDMLFRVDEKLIHVGHPTNADTVYLTIKYDTLPSDIAYITVPRKLWRNRPRGHNVAYIPKYRWEGAIGDTEALQKWIIEIATRKKDTVVTKDNK